MPKVTSIDDIFKKSFDSNTDFPDDFLSRLISKCATNNETFLKKSGGVAFEPKRM